MSEGLCRNGGLARASTSVDEVVAPLPIAPEWLDGLGELIASAPVNLVSRGDRDDVRRRHLDECVSVARALRPSPGSRWMDLGTGGGLPGLVLAAAFPTVSWTLIDARSKKIAQVEGFVHDLGLANVTTLHARAEDLWRDDNMVGRYDGVVSRAVAGLVQTVALARAFVTNGELIVIRGSDAHVEARRLEEIADELDATVIGVEAVDGTIRTTWLVRVRGRGRVPPDFWRSQRALTRRRAGGRCDDSSA